MITKSFILDMLWLTGAFRSLLCNYVFRHTHFSRGHFVTFNLLQLVGRFAADFRFLYCLFHRFRGCNVKWCDRIGDGWTDHQLCTECHPEFVYCSQDCVNRRSQYSQCWEDPRLCKIASGGKIIWHLAIFFSFVIFVVPLSFYIFIGWEKDYQWRRKYELAFRR